MSLLNTLGRYDSTSTTIDRRGTPVPSETTNGDAHIDNGDFYVEPWTVRQLDGALIVADETPAGDYLVTAIVGIVAVAVAGTPASSISTQWMG